MIFHSLLQIVYCYLVSLLIILIKFRSSFSCFSINWIFLFPKCSQFNYFQSFFSIILVISRFTFTVFYFCWLFFIHVLSLLNNFCFFSLYSSYIDLPSLSSFITDGFTFTKTKTISFNSISFLLLYHHRSSFIQLFQSRCEFLC